MTFAVLRSLHSIIGDALDEMERVYSSHNNSTTSNTPENTFSTPDSLSPNDDEGSTLKRPGHKSSLSTSRAYVSPPPSPSISSASHTFFFPPTGTASLDFPSLDSPCDPTSLSEALTSHPIVASAISRIIAASGQLSATVQTPFLTLCDAAMGYHLPSCMRLLEASHVVEILREAGPDGLHVDDISLKNGVDAQKLAHILRLLATHHIMREVSENVFTLNRISSLVDSGKTFTELQQFRAEGRPELKYKDTNGTAAFVGLCSDELQKSAAYMTETYYLSQSKQTRAGTDPARAPFCFAFDTVKSKTGFFGWLEGEEVAKEVSAGDIDEGIETGAGAVLPPVHGLQPRVPPKPHRPSFSAPLGRGRGRHTSAQRAPNVPTSKISTKGKESQSQSENSRANANRFRLERFGKAMSGTDGWEAPGAVLNGFDWHSLPVGSIVVDVGGGIGSTSMLLATAFSSSNGDEPGLGLKFIIQDRPVVCEMGEKAWKAKCPELLESTAEFQVHDFFTPQPIDSPSLFLLRVVLHDWPDDFARRILLNLRHSAGPSTKLLIADFVLPLACEDDMEDLEGVEGARGVQAPKPLLSNFGKASANVYWMDMTMQTVFNAQERTLREIVALTASAGWQVTKVTRTAGSHFGYLVASPSAIPDPSSSSASADLLVPPSDESDTSARATPVGLEDKAEVGEKAEGEGEREERKYRKDMEVIERASSRCGTPTFGSNMRLSSVQETMARFGGGMRARGFGGARSGGSTQGHGHGPPIVPLKPALSLSSAGSGRKKTRPSPLSVPPVGASPPPRSPGGAGAAAGSRMGGGSMLTPLSATMPVPSMKKAASASSSPREQYHPAPGSAALISHSHSHSQGQMSAVSGGMPPPISPKPRTIPRRLSLANLRSGASPKPPPPPPLPTREREGGLGLAFPIPPVPTFMRNVPGSPSGSSAMASFPRSPSGSGSVSLGQGVQMRRRASHANLSHGAAVAAMARVHGLQGQGQGRGVGQGQGQAALTGVPPLAPSFIPIRTNASGGPGGEPSSPGGGGGEFGSAGRQSSGGGTRLGSGSQSQSQTQTQMRSIPRRASTAQLPQVSVRTRSGTVIGPGPGPVFIIGSPRAGSVSTTSTASSRATSHTESSRSKSRSRSRSRSRSPGVVGLRKGPGSGEGGTGMRRGSASGSGSGLGGRYLTVPGAEPQDEEGIVMGGVLAAAAKIESGEGFVRRTGPGSP